MSIPKLLSDKLQSYRNFRQFKPEWYLQHKQALLEKYFSEFNIKAAVVGVSGGIDSAVTAGILAGIAKRANSTLTEVYGVLLPVRTEGCTNQEIATKRGEQLSKTFNLKIICADLSAASISLKNTCDQAFTHSGQPWASGQLASYIRTPALYYTTSLLNEQGKLAVVCGTTNRDEGAYIGFFGKASDAMVDLQIISDIHKSEVYQLAAMLGVPSEIIEAVPSGDVFDGRVDQQMIGLPYEAVELYSHLLTDLPAAQQEFFKKMEEHGLGHDGSFFEPLKKLHKTNLHKYMSGSTAVHFDVCERAVPGGWKSDTEISDELYRQIRNDPIYRSALPLLKTRENINKAGLFIETQDPDSSYEIDNDLSWYATPLSKIKSKLDNCSGTQQRKVVLITTGALCPVHTGHIHMMNSAKEILERRGFEVIGGFLSPSHDEYVSKKCASKALTASHRISLCQQAIQDSSWLAVDSWESLYAGRDVNFTKTVFRLSRLMQRFFPTQTIDVFYVCGGDNAEFALSFVAQHGCVVIPRDAEEMARMRELSEDPLLAHNSNIIFATETNCHAGRSTVIRMGDISSMETRSAQSWLKWQEIRAEQVKASIQLRDESVSDSEMTSEQHELSQARNWFAKNLGHQLQQAFSEVAPPDDQHRLELKIVTLKDQLAGIKKSDTCHAISLDPFYLADYNIACSRCFDLADSSNFLGICERPGTSALQEQIQKIPPGYYTLIDDDRSSGITINTLLKLLPDNICIEKTIYLSELTEPEFFSDNKDQLVFDLGDVRDFLPGVKNGGLVVRLPNGQLGRVPYILPYVQPSKRISLPHSSELKFSRKIWELAADFYSRVTTDLKDTDPAFQAVIKLIDLPLVSMRDICIWHAKRIRI